MLYSGADLIRTSTQQTERYQRLAGEDAVRPLAPAGESGDDGSDSSREDMSDVLRRFAKFFSGEKEREKKPTAATTQNKTVNVRPNPYVAAEEREARLYAAGQTLDIYA